MQWKNTTPMIRHPSHADMHPCITIVTQ